MVRCDWSSDVCSSDLYWHQNVIDAFSTFLPELAYRNMTPEQFCSKLTEAALKN
jgi:raffinose/stachyose/melibiose transport system substrate-binding protein